MACEIYAVYGFETYLTAPKDHDAYMPTPELSFAVRELAAAGGLNVSASHNHPDDNGFKVYTPTGGQYCPPDDATLSRSVEQVELDPEIERLVARYTGAAAEIPAEVHRKYIGMYVDRSAVICASSAPAALGGAGRVHAAVRNRAGQRGRDADRGRIPGARAAGPVPGRLVRLDPAPVAEPRDPRRGRPGDRVRVDGAAELVLSTDPDADRLGVEVRLADGTWQHLTGNQIGALIAYFLVADPDGPRLAGPLITTVATSRVLRAIAALGSGVAVTDDLMIGFKFIGQLLDTMADSAGAADLVLASEESHGYLTTTSLRDKDAASGGYLIAHLHTLMRSSGRTLWDYLMEVFAAVGVHIEHGRSLVLLGADGAETIKSVMRSLRSEPLATLGSEPVLVRHDFLVDGTDGELTEGERASRDVLELISEHYRMVVRASGTEAKLKYYFDFREGPRKAHPGSRRRYGTPVSRRLCGPTARLFTPNWPGERVTSSRPGH